MKKVILLIALSLLSISLYANPPADKGKSSVIPGQQPPGLSKKNNSPPGLEKQAKTPPGWSEGKKEGWSNDGATPSKNIFRSTWDKFIDLFHTHE